MLPNDPKRPRFLRNNTERHLAIERLRENNTGMESTEWKWYQVQEYLRDPKTWAWSLMYLLMAIPSGGLSAFGPGFTPFETILVQIPTGIIQIVLLWTATWVQN